MSWPLYQRRLHHYETDSDGVCHFSNYFRIAEEALFQSLVVAGFEDEVKSGTFVVIRSSAEYKRSVMAYEEFSVSLRESTLSRASFGVALTVATSGGDCATVQLALMAVDAHKQPTQLPTRLREYFGNLREGAVQSRVGA